MAAINLKNRQEPKRESLNYRIGTAFDSCAFQLLIISIIVLFVQISEGSERDSNKKGVKQVKQEILFYENFDLTNVITPVNHQRFKTLLQESSYDKAETEFLAKSFEKGFRLEYHGDTKVQLTSNNLKFRGTGNEVILWNKVMKEIRAKRYAGPFKEIPYEYFIQSPIGLVPKDNGTDTRLIFHLSHPRGTGKSVNANIPESLCKVKYPDFNDAIQICIQQGRKCYISKSDIQSAFRNLGIFPGDFCWLLIKAKSPIDQKFYYMVDKAVPFGSSISCSHFQRTSNGIAHIVKYKTGKNLINYLDDYLFAALIKLLCNNQIEEFMRICSYIGFPVNIDKTFWGSTMMVFLGLLIDTVKQTVSLPIQKVHKGLNLILIVLNNKSKKITLKQLQKICGFLNFMGRAIVPGRAFTRRLQAYTGTGKNNEQKLKPHHHIRITGEMRMDLVMWTKFLQHTSAFCRPFLDFSNNRFASEIDFYTDASGRLGFGVSARTHG